MALQQPFNSIEGTATFFISRKSDNDVAIRLESLFLVLNEVGNPNGGLGFIVSGTATVVKAILFDELKRIRAPIFALGFYHISMREKKNWFTRACTVIPDYKVRFCRDRASNEDVGIRKSCILQPRGCAFRNRRSRTRRIAGLNFNKLFIDIVSKLSFRNWPRGLGTRRKAKQ